MNKSEQEVPQHLSLAAQQFWGYIMETFELEPHHEQLLQVCCESLDRMAGARKVLDRDGPTFVDRFGQPAVKPEVKIERDAQTIFIRALRELDLDREDIPGAPRSPALGSNRG